ncbi:MAG TPA: hypothetical protein VK116_08850, partial [Planctomycetota bacterium]|nr:hypothetical protein [Planctomycetota bacterium]
MPSSHLARRVLAIVSLAVAPCLSSRSLFALEESNAPPTKLERVRVSDDGKRFELVPSGKPFTPIGFNYDHDEKSQLIEEYWEEEWERVVEDFHEMKRLGANVVRIHLQFDQFMTKADEANEKALERLRRLLELAEK